MSRIMCAALEKVTPEEWEKHRGRLETVETSIQKGKVWLRTLAVVIVTLQGGIATYLAIPNQNSQAIMALTSRVNSNDDRDHVHQSQSSHISYEDMVEKLVPRGEVEAKLEAVNARQAQFRADTERQFTDLKSQALRTESKIDSNTALMMEVLREVKK